ncbi:hypothetical protein WJ0W_003823 [Paenibacillus melissococcoides]|uniref:Uncharacterized protein n=1 Tax=Paenibacillus melissococcoides TaxID=2912268 RepID=A0ABM9G4C3_9BACL|nr:hypothetical protein WJ0W_003823 [Paenibacillus melissococcoides]
MTVVRFVCSACLMLFASPRLFTARLAKKAAEMQFSLITRTPLQAFLHNRRNFSHVNRLKPIIGEINALLQEFHKIAAQIPLNPACLRRIFTVSSIFRHIAYLLKLMRRFFSNAVYLPQTGCRTFESVPIDP